jgi:hypothetical protein
MTFALYLIGFLILIGGLAYGAMLLGVPHIWIIVGALVLLGIGIASGASRTRHKDPA